MVRVSIESVGGEVVRVSIKSVGEGLIMDYDVIIPYKVIWPK